MLKTVRAHFLRLLLIGLIFGFIFQNIISPTIMVIHYAMLSQKKALKLLVKQEKTSEDIVYLRRSFHLLSTQSHAVSIALKRIAYVLPVKNVAVLAEKTTLAISRLPIVLGDSQASHIVLFFMNNYELRPGGGFIGSVGFVTIKNYTITHFEVQDVYELDGRITEHYDPHYAVRRYLNQPNEFLRDSNFSPYFSTNAQKALLYLSLIPDYNKHYRVAVGVTTTAFENLLRITGPIDLPDFNATISASNFQTFMQNKIETNFFPGSKQKKTLLQSLGTTIQNRLEFFTPSSMLVFIYKEIAHKNLVFYSNDDRIQDLISQFNGERLESPNENWLMAVDANVGVNKIENLIKKTMTVQMRRGSTIENTVTSTYSNTITTDARKQEQYKNYYQLYLPKNAVLKTAFVNTVDVTEQVRQTEEETGVVLGIYTEIPPSQETKIAITYTLPINYRSNQIRIQKQIGATPIPITVIYQGEKSKIIQKSLTKDMFFNF